MTDAINRPEPVDSVLNRAPVRLTVSLEAVLYILLGVLALSLRFAELDTIPLNHAEAHEALAAWHFVRPDAAGTPPLASSPLIFALNSTVMFFFGGSAFLARFMTAFGGVLLVLMPLLWRRELGHVAALCTSALLVFSPVAMMTARTMSPAVWSMLLAVLGLWAVWRYVNGRKAFYAVTATIAFLAVGLLADPAGYLLLVSLAVAWWIAVRLSEDDAPAQHPEPRLRAALAEWPWRDALVFGGAGILLTSTMMFLFPTGLSQVGELLNQGLKGLVVRPVGHPFAFPLLAFLYYEPVIWFLGAIGVVRALRDTRFVSRFLLGWLVGCLAISLVYAGAGPDYALWLVVPVVALAGRTLSQMLQPVRDAYWQVPSWAVSALAFGIVALLYISSTNLAWVARALLGSTDIASAPIEPLRTLLAGMALLLLLILFFLAGSLWGTRAASRGLVLGLSLFLWAYTAGSAWQVAVTNIDDPHELWHVSPVNRELGLLRETVQEASLRQTGMPHRLALIARVPDDGAVAWQLRDYADVRYVSSIERRADDALIIAPQTFQPDLLGARYVGQDFVVSRSWNLSNLRWTDALAWIMYREARARPWVEDRVVVWMRDDVYGLPPEQETSDVIGEETAP